MLNIEQIRRDTPSTGNLIHFNNAGASMMPQPVYDAVIQYLESEQRIGGYETADAIEYRSVNFYQQAANLLNCEKEEIAFCESATRAWQNFFYSMKFQPGDRIVTTQLDYGSNFVAYIQQRERLGIEFDVVESDANGDIDLHGMEKAITERTKLISIGHIPTANGIIQSAIEVGKLAKAANVPYLLDACQSMGQIEVDVKKIGCTALSAAGRKYLRGPRGSGLLFVDQSYLPQMEPHCLDQYGVMLKSRDEYVLKETAKRFENLEVGFAARVGLGRALQYINDLGIQNIEERVMELGAYCRQCFSEVPGLTLLDQGKCKGGIVMFSMEKAEAREIRAYLNSHGVNIWVSSGPGSLIDFQQRGISTLARASIHYYNTEEEIGQVANLLRRM